MYSVVGLLAVAVHCIINSDIFGKSDDGQFPARREYRYFLSSVIAYHVTDALWGLIYEQRLPPLLYADTALYFAMMALSVLLWTTFVIRYLEREKSKDKFGIALNIAGQVFFVFQLVGLAANFFTPIFFSVDDGGAYHAAVTRYAALAAQILMFFLTSAHTLLLSDKMEGAVKRRHFAIGAFGVAMVVAIVAQIYYPLWPMYSIGYLLGGCVLHTFVVEDEKAEYLLALAESMRREEAQQRELGAAKHLVYTDSLTGVKSKHAYAEAEADADRRIAKKQVSEFAVAVFDVNGLKHVNDTLGHEAGNMHIISASHLICEVFTHSPIFRIGGDEFVTLLEGQDYENRVALMKAFERRVERNLQNGQVVISAGISDFEPGSDNTCNAVFQRADERMYERKRELKEMGAITRE